MAEINILKLSKVKEEERIDSEYFQKNILKLISKIENLERDKLVNLCSVKSGRTPQYNEEGKTKVIRSGDLNRNLFIDGDGLLKTSEDKLFFVHNKDILISAIGRGSIGKINIYDEREKSATVSEVNILRDSKINPYYLFVFLRTTFGQEQINREITGATGQQHLLKSNVKKIVIPIPSELFQKKIEKMVLQAKDNYDKSKELYENAENLLLEDIGANEYVSKRQLTFISRHKELFEKERIDADYFQPKYNKIIDKIKSYSNGSDYIKNIIKIKDKNFIPSKTSKYKYIELSSVIKYGWINDFIFENKDNLPTRARRLVNKGDVIISSIKGSSSSCALITEEFDNSLCSTGFFVINSKVLNPETILVLFKSALFQELLKRGCSGTILMAIGKKEFEKIILPLIKKDVQEKISVLITESSSLRKQSENILEEAKREIESLIESKN